jgi:cytoskeletal protein CcmA (bactofilin family)
MIFKRFRKKDKKTSGKKRSGRAGVGPSIITAEVVIEGNLLSGGELQIDGEVNGDVRARAVVIDINGIVHGEVAGEDVIVRGRIIGPIRGLHVHILNGAHVEGDVLNETISIENGAFLDGKIHRVEDPLGEVYSHQQPQPASAYAAPNYNYHKPSTFEPHHEASAPKNEDPE